MYYNEEYGKYVVDLVIILIMKLNNVKLKKNVMIKNILMKNKKNVYKKQNVKKKNISVIKKENVYLNLIAQKEKYLMKKCKREKSKESKYIRAHEQSRSIKFM